MPKTATTDIDATLAELEAQARRRDIRVAGPFDGRWLGPLTVPLRIFDLSLGGCLIQSFQDQTAGRRIFLEIELPWEGWIKLEAETVAMRGQDGFAAKFVDLSPETRARLWNVIQRLDQGGPQHW
jgi:PilZ domain